MMLDHIILAVSNVERSLAFYEAALKPIRVMNDEVHPARETCLYVKRQSADLVGWAVRPARNVSQC
jgi:catechol 2,3-dioxygenase-like lactoylglutathione lyase family enzyme